jgi:hypothetical protein
VELEGEGFIHSHAPIASFKAITARSHKRSTI